MKGRETRRLMAAVLLIITLGGSAWVRAGSQAPEEEKTVTTVKDSLKAEPVWKAKLAGSANLTQTGYSNWAKGGENTIAWSVRLDGDATRTGKKWSWHFTNITLFGQTKQEDEPIRNTLDKVDADATVSCKTNKYVNPFFSVGLLTQLAKGYDYKKTPAELKSDFWDPAYLTLSAGAKIQIKKIMNSQLGMGFKETMTREFTQYSDNPKTEKKENYKFETGITSKTHVNAKLSSVFSIRTKLELFSSFEALDIVDMNWDTLITAKLNKYIIITLNVLLNYDKDVLDKLQFKEITAVGLSYTFI